MRDPTMMHNLAVGDTFVRQAFHKSPVRSAERNAAVISLGDPDPPIVLIRSGFAVRSCMIVGGRRAVLDLFIPGDFCGLDRAFPIDHVDEVTAVGRLEYHALAASVFRTLLSHSQAALRIMALVTEASYRIQRIAATIGRLDARERICVFLLDIYDRLRSRDLVKVPTFPLPLTQHDIADYLGLTLVHVNRTLRRLREEGLIVLDHQVITIPDPDRLRAFGCGLPKPIHIGTAAGA